MTTTALATSESTPPLSPEQAVLLATHARELAALIGDTARTDPECASPDTRRSAARRGGMIAARLILTRYADDLDQQAAGGERK